MPSKLAFAAALVALLSMAALQPAGAARALRDTTSDAIEKTRQCLNAAVDGANAVGSCGEAELTTECVQDLGTAIADQEDFEGCARTLQDVLPKLPALVGKPIKDAVDTAANQVAGAGATAVDAVKGAATTAVGAVMDAGAKAGGAVAGAAEQAGGAIKSGLDTAGSTLKDVGSSIGSWFTG